MRRIFTEFTYDPHFTTIITPLSDVLLHRRGVCQDFAHLMIACLRSLGLAARYVSGYLETLPPPGQVKLQGSDASHAWLAVYVPGRGWIDFDPTNNQIPTNQHITTAWGRDYSDVTPLKGIIFGGGEHLLSVSVDVNRATDEVTF
jgi:transglutaminase-like putative cysteine protease